MGDFTLEPAGTFIVGMTGSGKSTFAYRLLLNSPDVVCRFVFDDLGRAAVRLGAQPACTAHELEQAVPTGWVIFNPHKMFPPDLAKPKNVNDLRWTPTKAAYQWFCRWVYDVSKRGPGRKQFLTDEVWQWQNGFYLPPELSMVTQAGREEGIEFICATQRPNRVNDAISGGAAELVCFRLQQRRHLVAIEELDANPDEVSQLPLGHFISYNRLNGAVLRGKVF